MTQQVQAKFYVQHIERPPAGSSTAASVNLQAVCRGAANRGWASYTPAGSITMSIRNDAATDQFEQGAEYMVTFTKVEKPQLGDGHQPEPMPSSYKADGVGYAPGEEAPDGYYICAVCGVCPTKGADGTLDWSTHHELYDAA